MPLDVIPYNNFVATIFRSPDLDKITQGVITVDLQAIWRSNDSPQNHSVYLLERAASMNYSIVTRFIPPYCSTVTFYKDTVGFVTVSRLDHMFATSVVRTAAGHCFTQGACDTLVQAYYHTLTGIHLTRNRDAHVEAASEAERTGDWPGNNVYIRLEAPTQPHPPHCIRTYDEISRQAARASVISGPLSHWTIIFRTIFQQFPRQLRIFFHNIFVASNVSFTQGPATVMNDIIYNTHGGKYANKVHIIGGELSAHLNIWGRMFAFLNLSWIIALVAATIALPTAAWISDKTGKIIAAAIVFGLLAWQSIWTCFVATTTYENITSNDIRLLAMEKADALFGLNRRELKLLLTMVSAWKDINAHGDYNSYLDVAGMGA